MDKSSTALSLFEYDEIAPSLKPVKKFKKKRGPWRFMTVEERQVFGEIEAIFALRREVKKKWREKKLKKEKWERGKKPKMPPVPRTPRPIDCVILGVDPGRQSGWCLMIEGEIVDYGHCASDTQDGMREIDRICTLAVNESKVRKLPLMITPEKPGLVIGKGFSRGTVAGIEAARRTWINAHIRAGGQKGAVTGVTATEHRKVVFGFGGMDRKTAQDEERKYALRVLHVPDGSEEAKKLTADECAAIAQTHGWASTSGIVAMKINKCRRYLTQCQP
jgi:hypothetical protein